jgi:hypothetical protein
MWISNLLSSAQKNVPEKGLGKNHENFEISDLALFSFVFCL